MFLNIHDNTTIKDIQESFSDFYPYLRIGFFKHTHKKYQPSKDNEELPPSEKIGDIKNTHVSAVLEIQPWYKIADVEKEFQQRFGLSVQILKMEKGKWEQTTGMDDFTFKELNELGRSSDDEFIITDTEEEP
ncbi:hypothetical protein [Flavihumibacter profundi]|uniref:hypothetical protein n=1 Tax=Flavihumibacter profundi TaxID=2716883 RepID=UPI001CC6449D|nr:hypothetical protein [Flavihumibacter profundi]MBZ5858072.1 hypothetical protein [Flavihumibacter profundi]